MPQMMHVYDILTQISTKLTLAVPIKWAKVLTTFPLNTSSKINAYKNKYLSKILSSNFYFCRSLSKPTKH